MTDSDARIEVAWARTDERGVIAVTVRAGDATLHVDVVRIADESARAAFVSKLLEKAPGLPADEVANELLRIAGEVATQPSARESTSTHPERDTGGRTSAGANSENPPRRHRRDHDLPEGLIGPPGPESAPEGVFKVGDAVYCFDRRNFGHIVKIDDRRRLADVIHKSETGEEGLSQQAFDNMVYAGGRQLADAAGDRSPVEGVKNPVVKERKRPVPPWRPFPVEQLPEPLCTYAKEQALALGVDVAFVAATMLVVLAAAIGGSRRLRIKQGWTRSSVLWMLLAVESGGMKSPVLRAVTSFIQEEESRLYDAYVGEMVDHRAAEEAYSEQKRNRPNAKQARPQPLSQAEEISDFLESIDPKPQAPKRGRRIVEDTTVEALVPILADNPRGLLMIRDEAAGFFDSLNEYKRHGGDAARWNAMYDGGALSIDRKGSDTPSIYVKRACVSILGGIQPGVLARRMTKETVESGLLARFLLVAPPRTQRQWTDAEVSECTIESLRGLYRGLFDLPMDRDDSGHPAPIDLELDGAALELWKELVNRLGQEAFGLSGPDAAWAAKLDGVVPTFALMFAVVREPGSRLVIPDDVERAARIHDWFVRETNRVRALLTQDDVDRERAAIIAIVRKLGGTARPRDLIAHSRTFRDAENPSEAARSALRDLAQAGLGDLHEVQSRDPAKPSRMTFRLHEPVSKSAVVEEDGDELADDPSEDTNPESVSTIEPGPTTPSHPADDVLTDVSNNAPQDAKESDDDLYTGQLRPCSTCGGRTYWRIRQESPEWTCEHCDPPGTGDVDAGRVDFRTAEGDDEEGAAK